MTLQKNFDKFLSDIEPADTTVSKISRFHTTLREYLKEHNTFGEHVIEMFLSGSYARHTMIRPVLNDGKRDVDVDIITNYSMFDSPTKVLDVVKKALAERPVYGKLRVQSHSVGIEMEGIGIDVVPLVKDQFGNLFIGNGNANEWSRTDPRGHAEWATGVNQGFCNGFKPLVKIFKWWRRENAGDIRFPKGITLEKIIADCLPEEHESTEQDLLLTMQTIVDKLLNQLKLGSAPYVEDPTIDSNNLARGYSISDFQGFIDRLEEHLNLIENEGSANTTWRKILGDRFPAADTTGSLKKKIFFGYEMSSVLYAPHKQESIWPMQKGQKARIIANVTYPSGLAVSLTSGEAVLPKDCGIDFKAVFSSSLQPCRVYWQVVNTGQEATAVHGLRGDFDLSNSGKYGRHEKTEYLGAHSIECYVVRKGVCVAKSDPFFVFIE